MNKRDKRKPSQKTGSESTATDDSWSMVRRHLRLGWWSLLLFLTLGIVLESMHGFKVQWYIGEQNATRRLMWTLAHAHGTLLSLIHLAYAAAIHVTGRSFLRRHATRSWCLATATTLMPLGFFLGGLNVYEGDPGLGILLVPVGAAFLFVAVLLVAIAIESST